MRVSDLPVEELVERVRDHLDQWTALQRSIEPADRQRAEAALRDLYAERGLAAPVVRWVSSPAEGAFVWAYARRTHAPIRNLHARGDQGTGSNHDFNNLADPFGLDPRWLNRMAQRVVERLPEGIRAPQPVRRNAFGGWVTPDPRTLEVLAGRLPTDDLQVLGQIRWAVEQMLRGEAVLGIDLSASARVVHRRPEVPRDRGLAIRLLGGAWDDLEATVGADLLEAIIFDGFADSVEWLLDPSALSRDAIQAMNPGQFDRRAPLVAMLPELFGEPAWRQRKERRARERQLARRLELPKVAGPWFALEGLAIVSERPLRLSLDDRSRLHAEDGPAIAYGDGFAIWAWHGTTVPSWVIQEPERITIHSIDTEVNAEVRRVLVERFGAERLLREGGSSLVHEDETGRLWSRAIGDAAGLRREEPIVMVEVLNSTPEPDGTRKTYFLRVPPAMRTPREAVAWTFGLGAAEYRPEAES